LTSALQLGGVDWESRIVGAYHKLSKLSYSDPDDADLPNEAWVSAHAAFHHALVAACGSPCLLKIRRTLYLQSERYRQFSGSIRRLARDVDGEHRELMELALARNIELICAKINDHFNTTKDLIMDSLSSRSPV
jgi:DNA-binding GntR family transcriptional regulator